MNIKRRVKLVLLLFIIVVFGYVFQTSVFSYLKLSQIIPNFLIIITCTYGFIYGSNFGMLSGIMCGLLMDVYSSYIFGVYLFIFILIGFISGLFNKFLYGDGLRLPLLLIAICDFLFGIGCYIVRLITLGINNFNFCLKEIIIPETLFTVLIALFTYPILKFLNRAIDRPKDPRRVESN